MTDSAPDIFQMSDRTEGRPRWRAFAGLTFRQALFQLHWLLGVSAGLVLGFMGVTGAMMGFEDEIMAALSPQARVEVSAAAPLPPDALLRLVHAQLPDDRITALQVEADPRRAYTITVTRRPADGGRNPRIFVDPYDGRLLGEATGADFFGRVRSLHRYLTASGGSNDVGRHITGIAAISVIFFALSGLYLRWPKRPLDWRAWFRLDLSLRGRALHRTLHSVIGSWLAIFYIISALSGLWWSYDWYREAVTSLLSPQLQTARPKTEKLVKPNGAPQADMPTHSSQPITVDGVLATVRAEYGLRLANVQIVLPRADKPARARVLTVDAGHDRALDDLQIDPKTGKVLKRELYAELKPGEWVMANMDPIHTGILFGPIWRVMVVIAALGLPMFSVTGLLLYFERRRRSRIAAQPTTLPFHSQSLAHAPGPLIVYASQTGAAQSMAGAALNDFRRAGMAARMVSIADIGDADLHSGTEMLFVASTYGDGHAPDSARAFERRFMAKPVRLSGLNYGVLALGDRRHGDFCAFGRRLDEWLGKNGGRSRFARLEVDAHDPATLSQWQRQIETMGAARRDADGPSEESFRLWLLEKRECLNAGSAGLPVFRIRLVHQDGVAASWQPGDIAEILPGNLEGAEFGKGMLREYSIASIASDGAIVLIVRQVRKPDGTLGLGSGWLTSQAGQDGAVALRIRSNHNFHPPEPERPMILIGNGTGIAGLHGHLQARTIQAATENWLFFGERNSATDFLMRPELETLQAKGVLKISTAFSRDQQERFYVQHRLAQEAIELGNWVRRGAAIYVCGSSETMAPAVDAALRAVLGNDCLDELIRQGRYRRDIY